MALEEYRNTMLGCTRCSYCKWIPFAQVKSWRFAKGCPSIDYYGFHTYSGGGRLTTALSILEGKTGYTDEARDIFYKCQQCGACDVTCKVCLYNMDVIETLREIRADLVEHGQQLPQHKPLIANLRKENNMLMQPSAGRGKWSEGLGLKDLAKERAEVAFFAGCRCSFDEGMQHVARTAASVLKQAGVDMGILGDAEVCCGSRAYSLGYRQDFDQVARINIEALAKAGVKTLVTPCSDCYWAFKRLYPDKAGATFEVLHTVELIDRLIQQGTIRFGKSVPMTVTYHDPCHLGRQGEPYVPWNGVTTKAFGNITKHVPPKPRYNGASGVYDAPRRILNAIPGLKLVEMERIREYAWCCGAGAGVREAFPDFSSWTATERITEATSTGAEALVTACPWCERNFIDAVAGDGQKMKVYDLVELVQRAI